MTTNWNNNKREWNIKVNETEFEILSKILYTVKCDSDWNNDLNLECQLQFTAKEVETLFGMTI